MIGFRESPRHAESVRRLFGDEGIVPPGIILESNRTHWAAMRGELAWTSGRITIAASAANNGRVQISNPAGSQRIVVVEGCKVVNKPTQGSIILTFDAAPAGAPAPNLALDSRVPINVGVSAPTVVSDNLIANNNAVISGAIIDQWTMAALTDAESILLARKGQVLTPGHNVTVYDFTVNETLIAIFWGYEIFARPEELFL